MSAQANTAAVAQSEGFVPSAQDPREFRHALGRFGTGVTIVTTNTPAGPIGMTVNSFASVSLSPPLVLWSASKSSGCGAVFEREELFTVNVLNKAHTALAYQFASKADGFLAAQWIYNEHGIPLLEDALARFECSMVAKYDGGDHHILVGKVERAFACEGEPLLFYKGGFGEFQVCDSN